MGNSKGLLFDPAIIPQLQRYSRIFFPLECGIGFARFRLEIFSPWAPPPELIGLSVLSGAFAFFAPERPVYLAGTVNNLARSRPFRLMLRLLQRLREC